MRLPRGARLAVKMALEKNETDQKLAVGENVDISQGKYTEGGHVEEGQGHALKRDLQGRHMQMIAIVCQACLSSCPQSDVQLISDIIIL